MLKNEALFEFSRAIYFDASRPLFLGRLSSSKSAAAGYTAGVRGEPSLQYDVPQWPQWDTSTQTAHCALPQLGQTSFLIPANIANSSNAAPRLGTTAAVTDAVDLTTIRPTPISRMPAVIDQRAVRRRDAENRRFSMGARRQRGREFFTCQSSSRRCNAGLAHTRSQASAGIQWWSLPCHLTLQPMGLVNGTAGSLPASTASMASRSSCVVSLPGLRGLSSMRPV